MIYVNQNQDKMGKKSSTRWHGNKAVLGKKYLYFEQNVKFVYGYYPY